MHKLGSTDDVARTCLICEEKVMAGPDMTQREDASLSAAAHVADALAEMVLGELAPGESIPSEAELATRFSVSRLTVREAVKMLTGRGLLAVGRGRRAVVREPDSSHFGDFLLSLVRNDPKGLFDLIELRMTIETQSAALAAKRASRANLQAIESALIGMRQSDAELSDGTVIDPEEQRFHEFDLQFHEAIATASGNRVIAYVFEGMNRSLGASFSMSRHGQHLRGHTRAKTLAAHEAVFEAIKSGKPGASAEAMRAHLKETEVDIRAHLANRGN
jgi:GntR family transcriptional regulator, transcriptional repressor for pyruvate dehydrogenase complex